MSDYEVSGTESSSNALPVMALLAAGLYLGGLFAPMVSGGGEGSSLASGGPEAIVMYLAPLALAVVAAFAGFGGGAVAGAVAVGVTIGLAGVSTFFVLFVFRLLDTMGDFGGVSAGPGLWLLGGAVVVAFAAVFVAIGTGSRRAAGDEMSGMPVACVLGSLAFLGVPLALLLPNDGFSVFDIGDPWMEAGIVVWAIVPPMVGLLFALTRRRLAVGLAFGVALGQGGLVIAMAMGRVGGGSMLFQVFGVGREGLFNGSVVAAIVLCGLGLAQGRQSAPVAMPAAVMPAQPPPVVGQWAADPFGRHQLRFWDGTAWSDAVSTNGVVSSDPPVAAPSPPPPPVVPPPPMPGIAPPPLPGGAAPGAWWDQGDDDITLRRTPRS